MSSSSPDKRIAALKEAEELYKHAEERLKRARTVANVDDVHLKLSANQILDDIQALIEKEDVDGSHVDQMEKLAEEYEMLRSRLKDTKYHVQNYNFYEEMENMKKRVKLNSDNAKIAARRLTDPRFVEFEKRVEKVPSEAQEFVTESVIRAFSVGYDDVDDGMRERMDKEVIDILNELFDGDEDLSADSVIHEYKDACDLVKELMRIRNEVSEPAHVHF